MPTNKIDLSSYMIDCATRINSALGFIDSAHRAEKAASDKAQKVLAPASLGASEASSARAIFENVDAQQDAIVASGLDPQKIFGALLNYASTLAQSAKSRLVDAGAAAA